MRQTILSIASSVCASLLTFILFAMLGKVDTWQKWVTVAAVGVVTLGLAWWASQAGEEPRPARRIGLGNNARTGGKYDMSGIKVNSVPNGNLNIADGVCAEDDINIREITVGEDKDETRSGTP